MSLDQLAPFAGAIAEKWLDEIWSSYPEESAKFMRSTRDRFANPVGAVYERGTRIVVEGIFDGSSDDDLATALDPMIRVRAVQDLKPSQAVSFLPGLCAIVRKEAEKTNGGGDLDEALLAFEKRVDHLLLVAFDVYMRCREELFDIKVKEIKNRSLKVMERLNEWRDRRYETSDGDGADTSSRDAGSETE